MTWRVGASRLPSRIAYCSRIGIRRAGARRRRPREAAAPLGQFNTGRSASAEGVESLLEAAGMRLLGLGKGLEPLGDLIEPFLARRPRHAGIHVGIFMRLAGDGGLEVVRGAADRLAGRRIADFLEEFEMPVRVAGLAYRRRAEHGRDVVVAFDIGLLREIEIAAIGLALAGEGGLQVLHGLRVLQRRHVSSSLTKMA